MFDISDSYFLSLFFRSNQYDNLFTGTAVMPVILLNPRGVRSEPAVFMLSFILVRVGCLPLAFHALVVSYAYAYAGHR